ncbi:MAG: M48 family metallopeptidase [Haloferacaceae archaeon]
MGRLAVRAFMALVGLSLLAFYGLAALLVYQFLAAAWAARPPLPTAVVVVVVATVAFGYLSYRFGTGRLLASLDASPLSRERAPGLHRMVDRLTEEMNLSRPDVRVARMASPNALALGSTGTGVLVLDAGLFRLLDGDELEAIVAHELAHLEGYDSLVQTLAFSAVRTVVGLLVLVLFPLLLLVGGLARATAWIQGRPFDHGNAAARVRTGIARLVALVFVGLTVVVRAHSRRREYAADDRAVAVTGNPGALARALTKIDRVGESRWGLLSPLYTHDERDRGRLSELLSTHPPIERRVERLRERAEAGVHRVEVQ